MKKNATLNINFAEFSDEQLLEYRNRLLIQREILNDLYVKELSERTKGDFDPYSKRADRIFKKILKKYDDRELGLSYLEDVVDEEMAKRENFREQQLYLANGGRISQTTVKEFLEKEQIKTEEYKSHIDIE